MMTVVVVSGALANKPGNGGEAWVRTSWVRGLQRLGLETWFVEELHPGVAADAAIDWWSAEVSSAGLGARSVLLHGDGTSGPLSPDECRDLLDATDLLVNISGALRSPDLVRRPQRRAYVDLDPGYTQTWWAAGDDGGARQTHQLFFTVGELLGTSGCRLPTGGVRWEPCRQPVLIEDWQGGPPAEGAAYTTVCTWRAPFGSPTVDGVTFESKHHAMRRLAPLPERTAAPLELAASFDPCDEPDRSRMQEHGWRIVSASEAAGSSDSFRDYVWRSAGEVSAAQGVYAARSGWFSDRSVRYLAAGRPVVVQETGFSELVATGDGLLTFDDLDGAAAALERVAADPLFHQEAALALAAEHFEATRVLGAFVERCGIS